MKTLLTTDNKKTSKGEAFNYKTYILYMSPFTQNSKGINLCPFASKGCADSCLFTSGFGGIYESVKNARIQKSEYFLNDRTKFLTQIKNEIEKAIKKHQGKEKIAIRLNGTTDISYEKFKIFDGKNIFELFPSVQFYDYTKNYKRFEKTLPSNYHLTFSRSETNHEKAMELLNKGFNVAMVFNNVPNKFENFNVVNGDETDLRFLDAKNSIVGLKYKKLTGKNSNNKKAIESGFVINLN